MSCARCNAVLLILFVALVALNWVTTPDYSKPNPDPLADMATSVPYDSFSVNENFKTAQLPGGMSMREPASGAIIFGKMPLHFGISTEAAELAGEVLQNPFAATDSAAIERGSMVFTSFCFACHGAMAKGDGPVPTRGFPPPPSIVTGKYLTYKDGQIFHIISYGMNNMPSYAKQILKEDRWRTILYVRTLQKKAVEEEAAAKLAALKNPKPGTGSATVSLTASASTQAPASETASVPQEPPPSTIASGSPLPDPVQEGISSAPQGVPEPPSSAPASATEQPAPAAPEGPSGTSESATTPASGGQGL